MQLQEANYLNNEYMSVSKVALQIRRETRRLPLKGQNKTKEKINESDNENLNRNDIIIIITASWVHAEC